MISAKTRKTKFRLTHVFVEPKPGTPNDIFTYWNYSRPDHFFAIPSQDLPTQISRALGAIPFQPADPLDRINAHPPTTYTFTVNRAGTHFSRLITCCPQSLLTFSRTNAYSLAFSPPKKLTMGRDGSKPKVIIFDWDDTICPSSFFDRQQIERMDQLPDRVSTWCTTLAGAMNCFR